MIPMGGCQSRVGDSGALNLLLEYIHGNLEFIGSLTIQGIEGLGFNE